MIEKSKGKSSMSKEFVKLSVKVDAHLAKRENADKLRKYIQSYFDMNTHILTAPGLYEKPRFSKAGDQEIVFDCAGITRDDVRHALEATDSKEIKAGWTLWSNEVYTAFTLTLRYFVKTRNKQMEMMAYMYMTVLIYSAIYTKYFPLGFAKKEVMDYTVSQLSMKYDLKRLGSTFAALSKLAENNHQNAIKYLSSEEDDDIIKYPRDLRTRINTFVKNIRAEFDINYKAGNYLNVDKSEANVGDEETMQVERTSNSSEIYTAAQAFAIWFSTNRTNEQLLRFVSSVSTDVSINRLRNLVDSVRTDTSDSIYNISLAVFDALAESQNDSKLRAVCNPKFRTFALRMLSKSNTINDNVKTLKKSVDYLLNRYCEVFKQTSREATKISYRKSLLLYISVAIQMQRCGNK